MENKGKVMMEVTKSEAMSVLIGRLKHRRDVQSKLSIVMSAGIVITYLLYEFVFGDHQAWVALPTVILSLILCSFILYKSFKHNHHVAKRLYEYMRRAGNNGA